MTVHHNFETSPAPHYHSQPVSIVRKPKIDRKRIRHIAFTGNLEAVREYAGATADALNAGLRARLVTFRDEAKITVEKLGLQISDFDGQAEARSTVLWRRLRSSDPAVRMTRMEVVQAAFYIFLNLVALAVATYALALMLTELGVVEKLSENIWRAVAYAFPVILASSGFASMATLHDDDKVIEERTMRVFKWGAGLFVAWIAMTALVFVGEQGGYNPQDILSADNDPFAAVTGNPAVTGIQNGYSVIRALFPSGLTSTVLLFVHIVAEVLIAAGLTARVVLMGRKTREIQSYNCPRATQAKENARNIELQKQAQILLIANYDGQIMEIDAVKSAFEADVMLLASSEQRQVKAAAEIARHQAEQKYLDAINELEDAI